MRMFVYGELCKPPVLLAVLGRVPAAEPAILGGFRRHFNAVAGYFRAVRQSDAVIVGLLLDGIDGDDLEVLDAFENVEGGEYDRIEVEVDTVGSARRQPAWAYIGTRGSFPASRSAPSGKPSPQG